MGKVSLHAKSLSGNLGEASLIFIWVGMSGNGRYNNNNNNLIILLSLGIGHDEMKFTSVNMNNVLNKSIRDCIVMNYCYELFGQERNQETLRGKREEGGGAGCQRHGPRCLTSDISSSRTT